MSRTKHKPPRLAKWLVSRLSLYNRRHSLNGDIEEIYSEILSDKGHFPAFIWYWYQTVMTFYMYCKLSLFWVIIMLKNYLKITYRTLMKYKGFSFINIFGLALSMTICLMFFIYVKNQKNCDQFHEFKDRIVRVYTADKIELLLAGWATTRHNLSAYLQDNCSFIEKIVRLRRMSANVLIKKTAVSISGMYAEPSFFSVFSYPLKAGDPATALNNPYSIIISEETARKFFGDNDPLNETLTLEKMGEFIITGVTQDSDQKSHFIFDALISFSTIAPLENKGLLRKAESDWSTFTRYFTYVLLKDANALSQFEGQLAGINNALIPEQERQRHEFRLQPLLDINLGKNMANRMAGEMAYQEIILFPFLAALVIFISCFNYIILSVARSLRRTKEIGLRKVIGSTRNQVIKLFLSETFVVTFFGLIIACLLIIWLVPVYNNIDIIEMNKLQIDLEAMKYPGLYIIFLGSKEHFESTR